MSALIGDLRPGDVVWLEARTPGAPAICYRQSKAVVRAVAEAYFTVDVAGDLHEVHRDNVRRTNPACVRTRKRTTTAERPAPPWPAGCEEVPLW